MRDDLADLRKQCIKLFIGASTVNFAVIKLMVAFSMPGSLLISFSILLAQSAQSKFSNLNLFSFLFPF